MGVVPSTHPANINTTMLICILGWLVGFIFTLSSRASCWRALLLPKMIPRCIPRFLLWRRDKEGAMSFLRPLSVLRWHHRRPPTVLLKAFVVVGRGKMRAAAKQGVSGSSVSVHGRGVRGEVRRGWQALLFGPSGWCRAVRLCVSFPPVGAGVVGLCVSLPSVVPGLSGFAFCSLQLCWAGGLCFFVPSGRCWGCQALLCISSGRAGAVGLCFLFRFCRCWCSGASCPGNWLVWGATPSTSNDPVAIAEAIPVVFRRRQKVSYLEFVWVRTREREKSTMICPSHNRVTAHPAVPSSRTPY